MQVGRKAKGQAGRQAGREAGRQAGVLEEHAITQQAARPAGAPCKAREGAWCHPCSGNSALRDTGIHRDPEIFQPLKLCKLRDEQATRQRGNCATARVLLGSGTF